MVDSLPSNGQPVALVVEDEPDVRRIICATLELKYQFHVVCASGGAEAYRLALEHKPQLIFLDLMLIDMEGWDIARKMRQEPSLASIPIIAISEYCWEEQVSQRAEQAGCTCCITKGYILDLLPSLIQDHVRST